MRQSDLEVDKRQDDLPTAAHYLADQPELFITPRSGNDKEVFPSSSNVLHDSMIFGLRKTTFWLSLALAVVTVLAAVGVGVAGSLAAKRGGVMCG